MKERDNNPKDLQDLMLRAKEGDPAAFEEVYTQYYTPLFQYILARIRNKNEAEDIIQTVFMKVWKSIASWNTQHTSPLAFFFTVARTTLIDFTRKSSSKEIISDEIVYRYGDMQIATDEGTISKESAEVMRRVITQLSREQQEIVELYYTQDLTYKEIAEITGKREDAIRQLHSRAIKKLRELYIQ